MSIPNNLGSCPTCGERFSFAETEAPPFCSQRCKMIDLGRWFNEEISLPYVPSPDDDEQPEVSDWDERSSE